MSSERHTEHTDILRMYHKHMHGTVEPVPSKKWLDSLEGEIVLFLGKLFSVKGFEKPLKNVAKPMESCAKLPNVKEHDLVLYNVASLINQLGGSMLSEALPLLANLIFMAKKDFSSVKTEDAKKLVLKFQEMVTSPAYVSSEFPETRLRRLLDIVDSIRKYSEYLLRVSGYHLSIGRSPREILRDLHKARNMNGGGG